MYNFKSLNCYNCKSVVLNLPELEITKLHGLSFLCECCGHHNFLSEFKFYKGDCNDPSLNRLSYDSLIGV